MAARSERKPASRSRVLRRLDGITYWAIKDPTEIRDFICNNVRKEWEADIAEQEDHEGGTWLGTIRARRWRLEVTELSKVKLSAEIMDYANEETGYNFRKRLEERKKVLEREIDKFGAVIRPLILRGEDMQLMDGYCRFHVLSGRGATRAFTYVGTLQNGPLENRSKKKRGGEGR